MCIDKVSIDQPASEQACRSTEKHERLRAPRLDLSLRFRSTWMTLLERRHALSRYVALGVSHGLTRCTIRYKVFCVWGVGTDAVRFAIHSFEPVLDTEVITLFSLTSRAVSIGLCV